jgi:NAD dependent epimerase/dehydratase
MNDRLAPTGGYTTAPTSTQPPGLWHDCRGRLQLNGKRILVTGADGFIGSHLTEELVRRGHTVRAFVLYNSFGSWGWLDESPADVRASLDVFAGDVRDPNGVATAMKGCDVVLHLAALIAIPYSYHSPDTYVETNIRGTLNVLQAARALGTARVVHTSTSEVYGSARFVPITEEHPLQGQSPYAATKIGADQLALSFHKSFGTPVTVARPFNTYGPRQSARAVIPTIITQLASGGRVLRLGALTPTRDFNYVSDTVAGFIHAAETDTAVGEVINYGSGHEISIGDTARLIMEVMGIAAEIEDEAQRLRPDASEVARLCADNRKARTLGWAPRYLGPAGLKQGLSETVAWFTRPEHLRRYHSERYQL